MNTWSWHLGSAREVGRKNHHKVTCLSQKKKSAWPSDGKYTSLEGNSHTLEVREPKE